MHFPLFLLNISVYLSCIVVRNFAFILYPILKQLAQKYYHENWHIFNTPRLLPKEVRQLPTSHISVISPAILQGTEPVTLGAYT